MSTTSLYCDDKITLNQHDELTLFLGVWRDIYKDFFDRYEWFWY
jgi:hypothetical protein